MSWVLKKILQRISDIDAVGGWEAVEVQGQFSTKLMYLKLRGIGVSSLKSVGVEWSATMVLFS